MSKKRIFELIVEAVITIALMMLRKVDDNISVEE